MKSAAGLRSGTPVISRFRVLGRAWRRTSSIALAFPPCAIWRGAGHHASCRRHRRHTISTPDGSSPPPSSARPCQLPVVITARGTESDTHPHRGNRPEGQDQMGDPARQRLGRSLQRPGPPAWSRSARPGKADELVLRNGVDLELFTQADRQAARTALDINTFTVLSVGSLIPRKGHHLAIEAIALRADCALLIAGGGPQRAEPGLWLHRLGVDERVRFLGDVPHRDLPRLYAAADVLLLASEREGWANVLLEAMACGTPVIATDVNGTSEVVRSSAAGRLIPRRTPEAIIDTLDDLRRDLPHRQDTRSYAEQFKLGTDPRPEPNRTLPHRRRARRLRRSL